MSATRNPGRRPAFPIQDAPAPGPAVLLVIKPLKPAGPAAFSVALLGHGRDYADRADAREAAQQINATGIVRVTVSEVFETMTALVAEWPEAEASMEGTARRLLAVERAKDEHAKAVREWAAAVEAAGREECGRCGGAGGYHGWPGFTCYECNGEGTVPKD